MAESFRQFPKHPLIQEGLEILAEKFGAPDAVGPVFVTIFLEETDPDRRSMIQRDAFERIQYLLRKIEE